MAIQTSPKGAGQMYFPKAGQMSAHDLTEGVDLSSSEAIGLTVDAVDCEEVGLKVILTDKLVRQFSEDIWAMVGRQVGDAMARKKDKDLLDLFDSLTSKGAAGTSLTLSYYAAVSTALRAVPVPLPIVCVLHPYTAHGLKTAQAVSGTYPIPAAGLSVDVIKQWHVGTWAGVPCFEDGNIDIDDSDDAKGGMFGRQCLGYLQSKAPSTERERDASLRATELVIVADYEAFVLDDSHGFEMYYDASAPSAS